jgi:NitT/TauT family transport system ATP-binding protein
MTRATAQEPLTAVSLEDAVVEFAVPGGQTGRALNGVSLSVRRGELLVIVGRSGCGKTTVLNAVSGLIQLTDGRLRVYDKSPKDARDKIGYMFARDALLPWRNAIRNVEYSMELRKREQTRRQRRQRATDLLESLGVSGAAAKRYPWQLSQGMRQRVALARTWAIDPELLLMDEPFAALDAQTRADAQEQFLDIWAQSRKTVIFVTHDLNEAILLGDRVVAMDHGEVVADVSIDIPRPRRATTIVEHPTFRETHHRLAGTIMRASSTEDRS